MSYLTFHVNDADSKGKLTRVYDIRGISSTLGQVRWYAPWRKYCFYPASGTLFDNKCLEEIGDFCRNATEAHKAAYMTGVGA